jgi:hypothetical protein
MDYRNRIGKLLRRNLTRRKREISNVGVERMAYNGIVGKQPIFITRGGHNYPQSVKIQVQPWRNGKYTIGTLENRIRFNKALFWKFSRSQRSHRSCLSLFSSSRNSTTPVWRVVLSRFVDHSQTMSSFRSELPTIQGHSLPPSAEQWTALLKAPL